MLACRSVSTDNPGSADPKAPLAGRYRFSRGISDRIWLASDLRSGRSVLVSAVTKSDAARFKKIKGIEDRHLASVLLVQDAIPADERPGSITGGDAAVVAELIRGKSLARMLGDRSAMPTARAVAWTLRMARSLLRLRDVEAAHGAISPAAIVDRGPGHPVAPVLSFFRAPSLGLALSPEVLAGSEPTPADDVWSLGVCLYAALTGKYPFSGKTSVEVQQAVKRGATPLSLHGIDDPVLQKIVDELLADDPARRLRSVQELAATLDAFELENQLPARQAGAKSTVPRPPSKAPLPRPLARLGHGVTLDGVVFDPAAAESAELSEALLRAEEPSLAEVSPAFERPSAPDAGRLSENRLSPAKPISLSPPSKHPFQKKPTRWPYVAALLAAAGAAGIFFLQQQNANVPVEPTKTAAVSAASNAEPKKPAPSTKKLNKAEKLDACVRSFFEDDQFEADVDFGFVCSEGPLYPTSQKLHEVAEAKADARLAAELAAAAASASAGVAAGTPPPKNQDVVRGDRSRRPLGWYELLASSIVRRSCCVPPPPVELDKTQGWCDQLDDVVSDLADDSARSGDLAPRVKRFDRAVDCLFANRVEVPYPDYVKKPLDEAQRAALQRFLSHAAVSEAKRRMLE